MKQFSETLEMINHIDEAARRFYNGERPGYSWNQAGFWTAGYGKLHDSGVFEFPLDVDQRTLGIICPL